MYKGVIYCAISPSNKKYYGLTLNFSRRKNGHKRCAEFKKCRFYIAIKKYGFDNFIWNIIETHENESKGNLQNILNEREKYWIEKDKTYYSEFGYNMTRGGNGGDAFTNKSNEDKERILLCKSNRFSGKNNPMYGKKVYDIWLEKYGKEIADEKLMERKKRTSNSLKGKSHPCSNETKEKIRKKLLGHKISEICRQKRLGKKNAAGKRNDEFKLKMSISHKGLPSPRKGCHLTIETKRKISESKLNKKIN